MLQSDCWLENEEGFRTLCRTTLFWGASGHWRVATTSIFLFADQVEFDGPNGARIGFEHYPERQVVPRLQIEREFMAWDIL
ncbi:MAG: hypothetical protein LBF93_00330 [Zoogloeaceae bacterium]|nr:hypothetical protein [Zoogloeaceae bacterium]